MIYKQSILTINGNNAKLDEDIYLFRLDKNIELYFTIVNNKYKFNKSDLNNIINLTNASYFQMRLYKNAEVKYTFAIQPTDNGKAILTITDDLIDEPIEVGDYDFQISLLDADKSSMISLPIVSKQIHVCEPLVTDASETGTAVLGLSTLESGEIVDAFDEEGNYIRKVHVNGELISAELFNKWEEALETNSSNIKTLDSQFKDIAKQSITTEERTKLTNLKNYDDSEIKNKLNEKANKNEIFTMANMGQDIKEAMTGGSVAVVGKNTVLTENVVPRQITPFTTSFFDIVNFMDISSVSFVKGYVGNDGVIKDNSSTTSIIFKVEPNTTYKLKTKSVVMNRGNIVGSANNDFITGSTKTVLGYDQLSNGVITFTTNTTTNYVFIYCISNGQELGYYENLKSDFMLFKNIVPNNQNDSINKAYLPIDTLYGDEVLNNYNLLSIFSYQIINASCNFEGKVKMPDARKSIIIEVEPNKKYYIQLPSSSDRHFVLSSTNTFIKDTTYPILTTNTHDNRIFSFTTNNDTKQVFIFFNSTEVDVAISEFNLTYNLLDIGKNLKIKDTLIPINEPWLGKKILTMGDSITAINESDSNWDRSWRKYFKEICNPSLFINTAVPGATWRDKTNTIYDGNPVTGGADNNENNVMGNQMEKILRGKDPNHTNYSKVNDYDDFDIIMIACGTNDTEWEIPTQTEIETQFFNDGVPITDLKTLNRKSWTGALRYTIDNLRRLYPNAKIYLCTPVQRTGDKYDAIIAKNKIIKDIARRLSCEVIDSMMCGVYDMTCPTGGQEGDYNDGLHLSPQGASKMGYFIANKIKNNYY